MRSSNQEASAGNMWQCSLRTLRLLVGAPNSAWSGHRADWSTRVSRQEVTAVRSPPEGVPVATVRRVGGVLHVYTDWKGDREPTYCQKRAQQRYQIIHVPVLMILGRHKGQSITSVTHIRALRLLTSHSLLCPKTSVTNSDTSL